jgi:hypothetical protein
MPIEPAQWCLTVLQSLIEADPDCPVLVANSGVFQGDRRLDRDWSRVSEAEAVERLEVLLRASRLPRSSIPQLEAAWRPLEGRPAPLQSFFGAVRRPSSIGARDRLDDVWLGRIEEEFGDLGRLDSEILAAVKSWSEQLVSDPLWRDTEAPLPGLPGLPLDRVWVELQLAEFEASGDPGNSSLRPGEFSHARGLRSWRYDSLRVAVERLEGSASLIGPPGCGKTTLLQWIARKLVLEPTGRFLLPLLVPLRRYAFARSDGLLEFACGTCLGLRDRSRAEAVEVLAEFSRSNRANVLLLLDGWDEVPVDRREPLLSELAELRQSFSMLVTSRPAGSPTALPTRRTYEVLGLSPESQASLVHRFFSNHGRDDLAERVLRQVEKYPDLGDLAPSPFLLTLFCALTLSGDSAGDPELPSTRALLYERVIEVIYRQHNDRYPAGNLTRRDLRLIDRLCLWLLDEAESAPRFVFDDGDVEDATGAADLLGKMAPARLINRDRTGVNAYHFVHATFQEYLAARALSSLPPEDAEERLRRHLHDLRWQEVLVFLLARDDRAGSSLRRLLGEAGRRPDLFYLLDIRLARLLATVGAKEGGKEILGFDVRDRLWEAIREMAPSVRPYAQAYQRLDTEHFARRIDAALEAGVGDRTYRATLENNRSAAWDPLLIRKDVLAYLDSEEPGPHYWFSFRGRNLPREFRQELRCALSGEDADRTLRALKALAGLLDRESVPDILGILGTGLPPHPSPIWLEGISALGQIGSGEALEHLAALVEKNPGSEALAPVVEAIGMCRVPVMKLRDGLLRELALRPAEDPMAAPLLRALRGTPIYRGTGLIGSFLLDPRNPVRRETLWVLRDAVGSLPLEPLAELGRSDPDEDIRKGILELFQARGRPRDFHWLRGRAEDTSLSPAERQKALEAALEIAGRSRGILGGEALLDDAVEFLERSLWVPEGKVARAAAVGAARLGEKAGPALMAVLEAPKAETWVLVGAFASLRKLGYRPAAEALLGFVRTAPEVREFFDPPAGGPREETLARHAAEALAAVAPQSLLAEPGATAFYALQEYSLRTETLIFADRIVDFAGRETFRAIVDGRGSSGLAAPPPRQAAGLGGGRTDPFHPRPLDLHWTIKKIAVPGGLVLAHELWSPARTVSIWKVEDEVGPFSELTWERQSRSIFEFLEGLLHGKAVEEAVLKDEITRELKVVGEQVWQDYLPPKIKAFFGAKHEEVSSLLIESTESWIPWELTVFPGADDRHLCLRIPVGRWFSSAAPPRFYFRLGGLLAVTAGSTRSGEVLRFVAEEERFLAGWLDEIPGLGGTVLQDPRFGEFEEALGAQGFDWLHFAGHGVFDTLDPDRAALVLRDRNFRVEHLGMEILARCAESRPLVFLNACRLARQGDSLVGLGGWPFRLVGLGKCGALVSPQWSIKDSAAGEFSRLFYELLREGKTLGEALREARESLLRRRPGDLTALAFVLYGDPNARVFFGREAR